jgi:hypothetical protein
VADSYIQVPVDSVGKKVRSYERTVGADDVHEHVIQVVDADTGTPASSTNPLPVTEVYPPTDYPLPTVQLESLVPRNDSGGAQAALVTNVASMIIDSEPTRHSLCITNNGSAFLYVSGWPAVSTAGTYMGHKLYPGGSFTTEYTGQVFGIYSRATATYNVAYTWVQPS